MPLVILCGNPCSGKSSICRKIEDECKNRGEEIDILNDQVLKLDRNEDYRDVVKEKMARGLLRSEIGRKLQRNKILVVDSLNLIKGYRYEIWCIARNGSTRCCLIHIDTPVEKCREWNAKREHGHESAIFDDLCSRLERPDSKNKWEAPLFTVRPLMGETAVDEVVLEIADYVCARKSRVGSVKADTRPRVGDLTPTLATVNPSLSSTNLLHDIDKEVQSVVKDIMQHQNDAAGGAPGLICFGQDMPTLRLLDPISVPELRRYKRTFIKLATNNTLQRRVADPTEAKSLFINFLKDHVK
eukprot:jgi/Picsp_1/1338/NSC_04818-R1_protein